MKHAIKVAIRVTLIALLSLLGVVLVICLLILLPPVQHIIKAKTEAVLSQQMVGQVSFSSAHLLLLNGITVRHIVMRDPAGQDSVSIRFLRVRWALLPLLHKTIAIRSVVVSNAYIGAVRTKSGVLRLPFMPAHPPKKNANKSPWTIALGSVVINGLELKYADTLSSTYCDLTHITSRFKFFKLDSLSVKMLTGPASVASPSWSGAIRVIKVEGILSRSTVDLTDFLIAGDQLRVSLHGAIPVSKALPWNANARIDAALAPVAALSRMKGLSVRQGWVWAEASIRGVSASPALALRAQLTGIAVNRVAVRKTDLYLKHKPNGHTNGVLSVLTDIGNLNADAEGELPVLMPKPQVQSYGASVKANVPSLADAAGRFGIKKTIIDGPVDLDLQVRGTGTSAPPDYANINFSIRNKVEPGREPVVQCRGRLENRRWNLLTLLDSANSIRTQGVFGPGQKVTGSFDLLLQNPAFITRLLFYERVTGNMVGSGTIGGTLKDPSVKAALSGTNLSWRGDTVKVLRAAGGYSRKKLALDRAAIEAVGKLQNVLPRFGIDAGGAFHLSASATAPRGRITGMAKLNIERPHYTTFNAAALAGAFTFRNDTLHVDELRIDKDTAHLAITGAAGMEGKRRFAAVSLLAQRRGFPDGKVNAAGSMAGALINASVDLPSFDLALIEPWIAGGVPVHGTVALDATVKGTQQNPSADLTLDFVQQVGRERVDWRANATLRNLLCNAAATAYRGKVPESLLVRAMIPLSLRPPLKPARMVRDGAKISVECSDLSIGELLESFMPRIKGTGLLSIHASAVKQPADWAMKGKVGSTIAVLTDSLSGLRAYGLKSAIDLGGTSHRPLFTVSVNGDSVRVRDYAFTNTDLRVRSTETMLYIDTVTTAIATGRLTAAGSVPWARTGPKPDLNGLQMRIEAFQVPLAAISAISPSAGVTGGLLNGKVLVTMREKRPLLNGNLSLRNGMVRFTDCGPEPGPLNAELLFRGDSIVVESLDGRIGKSGRLTGKGYLETGGQRHALITIAGSDLRQQCPDMDFGVSRLGLRIADSAGTLVLGGRITLAPSRYSLYVSPAALTRKAPPKPATGGGKKTIAAPERVALRTIIDLNRNLIIESNLGRVTLDGTITIVGTPSHPGIVGTISSTEGYVYYLNQKFTIDKATFGFFKPEEINPQLNLSASTQITSYGTSATTGTPTQQITYTVTVTVTGDAKKPIVTLTSQPPLSPELIVSLITFGTTQGVAGTELSHRIQGFLTQQIAGFGTRPLEQLLGLETLTIETQGSSGATVTATKRLSSRLAVTYQATLQSLGAPTVSATYRIMPFLYLEGTGYSIHAGGIDLHFRLSR